MNEEVWFTQPVDFSQKKLFAFDFDRALLHYRYAVEEFVLNYVYERLGVHGMEVDFPFEPDTLHKAIVMDHLRGMLIGIDREHTVREIVFPAARDIGDNIEARITSNYPNPIDFRRRTHDLNGGPTRPYNTLDSVFGYDDCTVFMALSQLFPNNKRQRYGWFIRTKNLIDECHCAYADREQTKRGPLKAAMLEDPHRFLYLPDHNIVELFKVLKAHRKILGIVSNSDQEYISIMAEELGIAPFLDFIVGQAGKPQYFIKGRYHELEQRFGVTANEVLYMGDDAYQDCVAPNKYAGWQTVVLIEEPKQKGLSSSPVLFGSNGKPYETHLARQIQHFGSIIVADHLANMLDLELNRFYEVQHGFNK